MERAASSSIHTPPVFTRSSAWTGPSRSPSAAAPRLVVSVIRDCISGSSRDGVT